MAQYQIRCGECDTLMGEVGLVRAPAQADADAWGLSRCSNGHNQPEFVIDENTRLYPRQLLPTPIQQAQAALGARKLARQSVIDEVQAAAYLWLQQRGYSKSVALGMGQEFGGDHAADTWGYISMASPLLATAWAADPREWLDEEIEGVSIRARLLAALEAGLG